MNRPVTLAGLAKPRPALQTREQRLYVFLLIFSYFLVFVFSVASVTLWLGHISTFDWINQWLNLAYLRINSLDILPSLWTATVDGRRNAVWSGLRAISKA